MTQLFLDHPVHKDQWGFLEQMERTAMTAHQELKGQKVTRVIPERQELQELRDQKAIKVILEL
jgi:hypothetical protein